ncbi:hypothetical protein V2H45_20190 [Tumidithrix elongata RA019]|uniref:HPt domain-containing protein n=1 Tax=Tumidithrix elongata BACA0141 TaxID=2716417 RepID=A0AAW9Q814_9CYAN|nr:hypothetical protein [Tumidithrix elongata RA019]
MTQQEESAHNISRINLTTSTKEEILHFVLPYFIDDLENYLSLFEDILIKSSGKVKEEDINTLLRRGTSPLRGEARWLGFSIFDQIMLSLNHYLGRLLNDSWEPDREIRELLADFLMSSRFFLDCLIKNENVSDKDAVKIFSQRNIPERLERLLIL